MEAGLSAGQTQPVTLTAEELCRRYSASVCRFAAIVASNTGEAEDLAQDALLRAIWAIDSYDPRRGTPEAWLWRIVVNASRDAARRRQRMGWLIDRIGLITPRETDSVETLALEKLRDADLVAHLRRLPERDRALLALRYGLGLDTGEAGEGVGLRAGSAGKADPRAPPRLRGRIGCCFREPCSSVACPAPN